MHVRGRARRDTDGHRHRHTRTRTQNKHADTNERERESESERTIHVHTPCHDSNALAVRSAATASSFVSSCQWEGWRQDASLHGESYSSTMHGIRKINLPVCNSLFPLPLRLCHLDWSLFRRHRTPRYQLFGEGLHLSALSSSAPPCVSTQVNRNRWESEGRQKWRSTNHPKPQSRGDKTEK